MTDERDSRLSLIRAFMLKLVQTDGPDLSARQLSVFLIVYMESEAQTVRGLAAELKVSKPAITRALDRLSEFDLIRRKTDPLDRRSVLVQRTASGMAQLREMRSWANKMGASSRKDGEQGSAKDSTATATRA